MPINRPLFIVIFSITCQFYGQETGIKFELGLTWEAVRAKAKAENKYIFVDCYATWCGPCKSMQQNIFPRGDVGAYYNAHFINVAVQMDRTVNDSGAVQAWYADAATLKRTYGISSYPTYLFFSPDGEAIDRAVGCTKDTGDFIEFGKRALDPVRRYYGVVTRATGEQCDRAHLLDAMKMAESVGDLESKDRLAERYAEIAMGNFTKEDVELLGKMNYRSTQSTICKFLLKNATAINALMTGADPSDHAIIYEPVLNAIYNDAIVSQLHEHSNGAIEWDKLAAGVRANFPAMAEGLVRELEDRFRHRVSKEIFQDLKGTGAEAVDWARLAGDLARKYPGYDCEELLLLAKVAYFAGHNQWQESGDAAYLVMKKYSERNISQMNDMIFSVVFQHCNDRVILLEAANSMRRVVEKLPDDSYVEDTYANLLYKLGSVKDAMTWEEMAITSARKKNDSNVDNCIETLEQMKIGKPTWPIDPSGDSE